MRESPVIERSCRQPCLAAAILFLLVTIPFTRWLDWLIRRQQAKTLAGR